MYEYYTAVLHAVREGLLLLDDDGRVQLVNDEARRLLDLPDDVVGQPARRPRPGAGARGGRAWASRPPPTTSTSPATARSWSARRPRRGTGRSVGAVVTLRDHTELQSVTGELEVVRGLTESLRSQTHEAANRLHTVVSLIEMGRPEEAVEFATEELQLAQLLTDRVVGVGGRPGAGRAAAGQVGRGRRARASSSTVDGDLAGGRRPVARPGHRDRQPGRQRVRRRGRPGGPPGAGQPRGRCRAAPRSASATAARGSPRGRAARPRARLDHQGLRGRRPRRRAGAGRPGRPSLRRVGRRRPVRPSAARSSR